MADDGLSQSLITDSETYGKVACCFLGLYTWELVRAYQWELDIVRHGCWRRPALLGASLCRLFTLTALIGMTVSSTNHERLPCNQLSIFTAFFTTSSFLLSIGLAMFSTIQFTQNRSLIVLFSIVGLFTISFRYLFVFGSVGAVWNPAVGCVPITTGGSSGPTLSHLSVFITFFAFIILLFCMLPTSRKRGQALFGQAMVDDRLLYFIALVLVNIPPAVLDVLHTNLVITQCAVPPAVSFTAILAGHLVRASNGLSLPRPSEAQDLFAHSSVVLGSSRGGNTRHTSSGFTLGGGVSRTKSVLSRPGAPSLHITTADLAPEPFPRASPPGFPAPDWAPAGATRLSMDSAKISPLEFAGSGGGEGNVHYALA